MSSTDRIVPTIVAELPAPTNCPHCNGTCEHNGTPTKDADGNALACQFCSGNGVIPRVIIKRNADQLAWRVSDDRGGAVITRPTIATATEEANWMADRMQEHGEQAPEIFLVDSHEAERDEILRNLLFAQAEARNAKAGAESAREVLDGLRRLVEALPWDDISTGAFHPEKDCPDVQRFIDEAVRLGCDPLDLRAGQRRPYTVTGVASFTFTVEIDEAEDEDDALYQAADLVDSYSVRLDTGTVHTVENDGYDWDATPADQ